MKSLLGNQGISGVAGMGRRIGRMNAWQISGLGAVLAGAIAFGCTGAASRSEETPMPTSDSAAGLVTAAPVSAQSNSVPETVLTAQVGPVDFTVCYEAEDWQRPDTDVQIKQLEDMARYGSALNEDPLQEIFQKFWTHQIFTFTTYGLSARMEPIYFSGLWTVVEDVWNCYEGTAAEQINSGEVAEIWLIEHQIESIEWTGDRYQVVVNPVDNGVQFVQFSRRDTATNLPVSVTTTTGTSLTAVSGDW